MDKASRVPTIIQSKLWKMLTILESVIFETLSSRAFFRETSPA